MGTHNMLLSNAELDQTGLAVRADGYYGYAGGMHTVGFSLKNFIGRVFVDATLSDNPQETDWFPISLDGASDFMEFDLPTTRVETFNVIGNFVYLRARIERSYLGKLVTTLGTCERVTLSL